jgi:membrane-associated phospholipid phosphatase
VTIRDVLAGPRVQRVDAWGEQLAARFRGRPGPDRVMYALTELGDWSLVWHISGIAGAAFGGEEAMRRAIRLSVTLGAESAIVNGAIKSLINRERPDQPQHPHGLRQPVTSSFPSGHASAAACAVELLSEGRPLPARVAWGALGFGVASSRVYVGMHHVSDVIAGAVVGAAIGHVARRLMPVG